MCFTVLDHQKGHTILVLAHHFAIAALLFVSFNILPFVGLRAAIFEKVIATMWTRDNFQFAMLTAVLIHFTPVNFYSTFVATSYFGFWALHPYMLIDFVQR